FGSNRLVYDGAKVARVKPTTASHRALFIRGDSLDLPRWQKEIGKREGNASENMSCRPGPTLGSIEVQDVCELVCENQAQPVIGQADGVDPARPHRTDQDRVVRQRRRQTVGELGLIGENDVGQPGVCRSQPNCEIVPRLLSDVRETGGQTIFAAMKIDDEMLRRVSSKTVGWIEDGRVRNRFGACPRQQANEERPGQALYARHLSETESPRQA